MQRLLIALGLAALLSACGSTEAASATTRAAIAPSIAPSTSTPTPTSPVASPGGNSEDARLLLTADVLILNALGTAPGGATPDEMIAASSGDIPETDVQDCMSTAGFAYTPGPSPAERVDNDVRYTLPAAEFAARYGLDITGQTLGIIPDPLNGTSDRDVPAELSASERDAYVHALDQCQGALDLDRRASADALSVAVQQFGGVVASDPRVVAALATWQDCMSTAGYDFDTPMAMRTSFYQRMNGGGADLQALFAEEVRVAVANVDCETTYNSVRREVISDRFPELKAMFETAVASGAKPTAQG